MVRRLLGLVLSSVLAAAGLVVVGAPAAHAEPTTYHFVALGDGTSWNDQMNWNPQGIPRFGDSIVVQQDPGGPPAHVTNVPTVNLATITVGSGGSLEGQPLGAASVHWTGGEIYNEVTAITLLQIDGDARKVLQSKDVSDPHTGKLIVEDQALVTGGEVRMIRGTIINNGSFASVGAPGSSVVVNGNFGATARGKFINKGVVSAATQTTLVLQNFDIDDQAAFGGDGPVTTGGTVEVSGGTLRLRTNATIDDRVVLDDAAVATADGNVSLRSGGTLTQTGGTTTTLSGSPTFTGTGAFEWLAGTINGKVIVSSGVTLRIDGTGHHKLDASTSSPFTVNPGGVVLQRGTGLLSLGTHTTIRNQGRWRVQGANAAIAGLSCCVPGSTGIFSNAGTLEVEAARTLTIGTPGIAYVQEGAGRIIADGAPGGRVVMLGSDSELRGGSISGVEVVLDGNTTVHVSNIVNINAGAVLRQTGSSDVIGPATFGGAGDYRWSDGTITDRVIFGASLTLRIDDPDTPGSVKYLYPGPTTGGRLDIRGPSTIATTQPVVASSTSTKVSEIVNRGVMAWARGTIDYAGVVGRFVNEGTLRTDPGATGTVTTRLAVTNKGAVVLGSGALAVNGPSFTQTAGLTVLNGHTLRSTPVLKVNGGTLRAPGRLEGSVLNTAGTVEFGTRGLLAVTGRFTQGAEGITRLVVAGTVAATRDRITAGAPLSLDGLLVLRRGSTGGVAGYAMLVGSSRAGRFPKVSGLGAFPDGYRVRYTATSVRLVS